MRSQSSVVAALLSLALQLAQASSAGVYSDGDTSGCGIDHFLNGVTQYHNLDSAGLSRSYGIHLPSNYSSSYQYPVIVGFHGSSSVGFFFEEDTKLDDSQYTGNKIMVYPNGEGGAWAGANYSKATVAQDLQFVYDMLADIRSNYCVDSSRIYATGLSIGGGFTGTLACNDTVGGEFAAFAPASGSFYTQAYQNSTCTPARDVTPILEFHGGADTDVFYNGGQGEGGYEPPIFDYMTWWAERNGCDAPPALNTTFNDDVHHYTWNCRGQTGAVQHYKTDDQKHDWPSTEPNFSQVAAGDLPTHIEASALIQNFFMNFTRPASSSSASRRSVAGRVTLPR